MRGRWRSCGHIERHATHDGLRAAVRYESSILIQTIMLVSAHNSRVGSDNSKDVFTLHIHTGNRRDSAVSLGGIDGTVAECNHSEIRGRSSLSDTSTGRGSRRHRIRDVRIYSANGTSVYTAAAAQGESRHAERNECNGLFHSNS